MVRLLGFINMIAITITEALVLTLTCLLAVHAASELCPPFENESTRIIIQEMLFSRQFPSCSDVNFAQNRPMCEVLVFSLMVEVQRISPYHAEVMVMTGRCKLKYIRDRLRILKNYLTYLKSDEFCSKVCDVIIF